MSKAEYPQGKNPNSLANLKLGRGKRPRGFDKEDKKQRSLSVTDTGWQGMKLLSKRYGCKSVSEFMEKAGRGLLDLEKEEELDIIA